MESIQAGKAARSFGELCDRALSGVSTLIERRGREVAVIGPAVNPEDRDLRDRLGAIHLALDEVLGDREIDPFPTMALRRQKDPFGWAIVELESILNGDFWYWDGSTKKNRRRT